MAKSATPISILEDLQAPKPSPSAILRARRLISSIHQTLSGREWDSDTTSRIADLLIAEGLIIREPSEASDD